jgi:predicted O-methyltransferase YrrM
MPTINFIKKLSIVRRYAHYLMNAKHRKGHGIHSPFLYELISKVIFDKKHYHEYELFNAIRGELIHSQYFIEIEDFGAKSINFHKKKRRIADMVQKSSVNSKFGKLLFRLVHYYKPDVVVELGTSLGLSAIYMAAANNQATLLTIEGDEGLCTFAEHLFEKHNIKNIIILHGSFDDMLNKIANEYSCPQFVFIDGDHNYDATMKYYEHFINVMEEGIIVFDDINWSPGMRKAWHRIKNSTHVHATIDLFFMGIVIKRKMITQTHYCVRF